MFRIKVGTIINPIIAWENMQCLLNTESLLLQVPLHHWSGLPQGVMKIFLWGHLHRIKKQNNIDLMELANWDYLNEGNSCYQRRWHFSRLIQILLIMEYILLTGDLFVRTQEKKIKVKCQHYINIFL